MPRSRKTQNRKKNLPKTLDGVDENDESCSDVTQLSVDDEDAQSVYADSVTNGETPEFDATEEKIKESLENVTHKNVSIRVEALKILQSTLTSHFVPGLLMNWKVTAADAIERCVRKKTGEECKRAVNLGVLLALQLGDEFNHLVTKFSTILKEWVCDWTMNPDFRAECVNALSLYTFITTDDVEITTSAFNIFREIWRRLKPSSSVEFNSLYCSCLNSWTLLLLNLPNRYLENALSNDLPLLCDHMENGQLEMRIASAEALCVLYELANQLNAYEDDGFFPVTHGHTLEVLEQMSRDSGRYQAKRDRRFQRATFREIYAAIKDQDAPEVKVKFGAEHLILDNWGSKLCYNALCNYLRGGINCHLQQNFVVRNKLGLGAPALDAVICKATKLERQILNQSVNKARSLARGKQRDKRIANLV